MKQATKHPDVLKSLCKKLTKEHRADVPPREPQDALRALVRATFAFDAPDPKADDALRVLDREYVDFNELRVATELEIQALVGVRYPQVARRAEMLTQCLNDIFEREHTLSLDRLKTVNKREARQFLRELPDVHPFVEAYVMMFAFDGNAMPIDDETRAFLVEQKAVDDEAAPLEDLQKFIEQHVKEQELYDFYAALRRAVYDRKRK